MEEYLNNWKKRIEKFIVDEPGDHDIEESQLDIWIDRIFKWLLRNVIPVLALSLIIHLSILFSTPVEVTKSKWFWLAGPISIIFAYILIKVITYLRNSYQSRND